MQRSVFWALFLLFVWGFSPLARAQLYQLSLGNGNAYLLEVVPGAEEQLESDSIFLQQLQKTTVLFIENHPDSLAYQYQRLYTERGFYETGDHLQNHLSKTTFASLETRLEELNAPSFGHHPRMKPWLLAETLHRLELKKAGLNPDKTLRFFIRIAKKKNQKIYLLKNFSKTLDTLSSLSDTRQIHYFENILKQSNNRLAFLEKLPAQYDNTDLEKFQELAKREYRLLPKSLRLKEAQKFQAWIREIENVVKKGETPLIVINLMHADRSQYFRNMLRENDLESKKL